MRKGSALVEGPEKMGVLWSADKEKSSLVPATM